MSPTLLKEPEFKINSSICTQGYSFPDPFHTNIFHCIFNQNVGQPELHDKLKRHFPLCLGSSTWKSPLLGRESQHGLQRSAPTLPPGHTRVLRPRLGAPRPGTQPGCTGTSREQQSCWRSQTPPCPPTCPQQAFLAPSLAR